MKKIVMLLAVILAVQCVSAQGTVPLTLLVNGMGKVYPLTDGQMLRPYRQYTMTAIPDRGNVFSNWQKVVVFTDIEYPNPATGSHEIFSNSAVVPMGTYSKNRTLIFRLVPGDYTVLFDIPNVRVLTQSTGWQANFTSRDRHP